MIYSIRRITLLIIFIFFSISYSFAQPDNTARITLLAGGNVPFAFSSMQQYATGITYLDFTTFSIEVVNIPVNNPPVIVSWSLDVEAMAANIVGDNPANTLPLSTLRLEALAASFVGCAGCISTGIQTLPVFGTKVNLVTNGPVGAPPPAHQVSISYYCGTVTPLLGSRPDHYVIDIEFTLKPCDGIICYDP